MSHVFLPALGCLWLECDSTEAGAAQHTEVSESGVLRQTQKGPVLSPLPPSPPQPFFSCPGILNSRCEEPKFTKTRESSHSLHPLPVSPGLGAVHPVTLNSPSIFQMGWGSMGVNDSYFLETSES